MTSKIIIAIVFLAVLAYTAIPSEWKNIYSSYNFSTKDPKIIIPVSGLTKSDIEDTYGAFRSFDRSHEGLDLFASRGTEVHNCCNGNVLYIGRDVYGGKNTK